MNVDEFKKHIEALRSRVAALLQRTEESPTSQQELLLCAFEELHTALEELKVAEEDLRQQNDELWQQNEDLAVSRAAVKEEHQRYQDLFEFAPDGYLVTDTEGTIQEANRAAGALLNTHSAQFLVGQPLLGFVAEEERLAFHAKLTEPRKGDWVREWEVRLSLRDRRFVDVALTVAAVREEPVGKHVALRWLLRDITHRKRAESALRESNERFRLLVEDAQEYAFITLDINGYLTSWNLGAERILGYQELEIIGQHASCIFTPEDRREGEDKKELRTAVAEGRAEDERWHLRKDGTRFWASGIVTSLRDELGNLLGFSKIMRDMTKHKQAEEEREQLLKQLEAERRRLEAVLQQMPAGVAIAEAPSGRLLLHNEEAVRLHHRLLPSSEIKDYVQYRAFHPDGRPYKPEEYPIARSIISGEVVKAEDMNYRRGDGTVTFVSVNSAPIIDREGRIVAAVSTFYDISDRKRAEETLQQLTRNLESKVQERTAQLQQVLDFEAMLKRITDKVRDSLDESQILQTVVQELCLVLGVSCCNTALYNLEQGTSTICYEYATSNPGAQARVAQIASFPEVYQQLCRGQYFQFCSIFPNPVRGRVAMLACPILDDQGVLGDLWLINQKDHAYNELEIRLVQQVANQCAIAIRTARLYQASLAQVEELEKLNQLKDDFLSTVSHELRTPMSNMKMAIQMLKTTLTDTNGRVASYMEILQSECEREIDLINDLLDLQRLEAASYAISITEAVSLQKCLPSIIAPFRERMHSRQQTLHINLSPDLPELISDRSILERILAELLNNACKYTPAGGKIALSVECMIKEFPPRTCTIFTISNSAEISALELPRIFDKFYRVPKADRWKQGGTGLGLALVQKLVEQIQGTIQVESARGWTTFSVELPNQPRA